MATSKKKNMWQDTQGVCGHTHMCMHVYERNVFFRCVYMHTCMRETVPCVCACTHMCRRERKVFCWVQNIYLQQLCKIHLHQGGEWQCSCLRHCTARKKIPWRICSKHHNNPQICIMFQVTGFIVRWEEIMYTACTEEKLYKLVLM